MADIGNKVLIGAFWMTLSVWGNRLIGMASTIILARLLLPDDYGLVAMASLVVNFLAIMSSTGMETYLIRIKDINKQHYNTAWTLNLLICFFLGVFLYLNAGFFSRYFEDARLEKIWFILSLVIISSGLKNIGLAQLKKEFNYNKVFLHGLLVKISGFITTIYLAYMLRNYWAMIYGTVVTSIFDVLLSYYFSSYRPWFSLKGFKEQWDFSKWIFLKNISGFVRQKTDQLVVTKILGSESMGYYSMASDISNLPAELIYPAMGPTYSAYSMLLDKPEELNAAFITFIGIIAVLAFPMFGGLVFVANDIVIILLGEKWIRAVEIIQFFSLLVILQLFSFAANGFLTALGKVKLITILDWSYAILLIPILIYAAFYKELIYVVAARAISYLFLSLFFFMMVGSVAKIPYSRMIVVVIRPLLMTLIMILVLSSLNNLLVDIERMLSLAINILVGCFVYALGSYLLWLISGRKEGGERFILANLKLI